MFLSHDVASGKEIMPCNKIDKPLVVYTYSGNVMTSNINNVAYNDKIKRFYSRNKISNKYSYDK